MQPMWCCNQFRQCQKKAVTDYFCGLMYLLLLLLLLWLPHLNLPRSQNLTPIIANFLLFLFFILAA